MQNNGFSTPAARWVSLFYTELIPTLKSHKVAGLFGLPPDDADAVVQTQNALNGGKVTFDTSVDLSNFAALKHVSPLPG